MKCAYCGKEFRITTAGWGYAYDGHYTCSYSCMRAMQREDGMAVTDEQKMAVDAMMADGKSFDEICEALGTDRKNIRAYYGARRKKIRNESQAEKPVPDPVPDQLPVNDDVRLAVIYLIQDMLDVLKRLYGI